MIESGQQQTPNEQSPNRTQQSAVNRRQASSNRLISLLSRSSSSSSSGFASLPQQLPEVVEPNNNLTTISNTNQIIDSSSYQCRLSDTSQHFTKKEWTQQCTQVWAVWKGMQSDVNQHINAPKITINDQTGLTVCSHKKNIQMLKSNYNGCETIHSNHNHKNINPIDLEESDLQEQQNNSSHENQNQSKNIIDCSQNNNNTKVERNSNNNKNNNRNSFSYDETSQILYIKLINQQSNSVDKKHSHTSNNILSDKTTHVSHSRVSHNNVRQLLQLLSQQKYQLQPISHYYNPSNDMNSHINAQSTTHTTYGKYSASISFLSSNPYPSLSEYFANPLSSLICLYTRFQDGLNNLKADLTIKIVKLGKKNNNQNQGLWKCHSNQGTNSKLIDGYIGKNTNQLGSRFSMTNFNSNSNHHLNHPLCLSSHIESCNLHSAFYDSKMPNVINLLLHNDINTHGFNGWFMFKAYFGKRQTDGQANKQKQTAQDGLICRGTDKHSTIIMKEAHQDQNSQSSFKNIRKNPITFHFSVVNMAKLFIGTNIVYRRENESQWHHNLKCISYRNRFSKYNYNHDDNEGTNSKKQHYSLDWIFTFQEGETVVFALVEPYSVARAMKIIQRLILQHQLPGEQNIKDNPLNNNCTNNGAQRIQNHNRNSRSNCQNINSQSSHHSFLYPNPNLVYPKVISIGRSEACNHIPLLIFKSTQSDILKSILILARQHPVQTVSSFICQRIIKLLHRNHPLLIHANVYVLPMLNVDGVAHGNSRTNLKGYDLNRGWIKRNRYHSHLVPAETQRVIAYFQAIRPEIVVDLHGHSRIYGCSAYFSTDSKMSKSIAYLLNEKCSYFKDFRFGVEQSKKSTLRGQARNLLGAKHCITVETSYHGYKENDQVRRFTTKSFNVIGEAILSTLVEIQSPRIELPEQSFTKFQKSLCLLQAENTQTIESESDPEGDYLDQEEREVLVEKGLSEADLKLKKKQRKPSLEQESQPLSDKQAIKKPNKRRQKTDMDRISSSSCFESTGPKPWKCGKGGTQADISPNKSVVILTSEKVIYSRAINKKQAFLSQKPLIYPTESDIRLDLLKLIELKKQNNGKVRKNHATSDSNLTEMSLGKLKKAHYTELSEAMKRSVSSMKVYYLDNSEVMPQQDTKNSHPNRKTVTSNLLNSPNKIDRKHKPQSSVLFSQQERRTSRGRLSTATTSANQSSKRPQNTTTASRQNVPLRNAVLIESLSNEAEPQTAINRNCWNRAAGVPVISGGPSLVSGSLTPLPAPFLSSQHAHRCRLILNSQNRSRVRSYHPQGAEVSNGEDYLLENAINQLRRYQEDAQY